MDTRVQRGADVNSDHYLAKTKIKLKLNTNKNKRKVKPRLNTTHLCDDQIRKTYVSMVKGKLGNTAEGTGHMNIEEKWSHQKTAYIEAAEEVLGYRKGTNKPWITNHTWEAIDQRRGVKLQIEQTKSNRTKSRLKEQ